MAATVDNKSDVSRQLGDDQENELLTAEEKEHSPTDPEKKEEVVEIEKDGSNLPEKTNHPLGTSCKLFPLHAWLYFLYIALAILLPIFGTLLIICGNWSSSGYFSLFAILNYPWPKLKLEDPNYTATSLELLQVSLSTKINLKPPPSADLLGLRFLLLVLLSLPRLRHRRLPQASLVGHRHHHHHYHHRQQHQTQFHHLCLHHQGQEPVGQAGLGWRAQGCRWCSRQGEGDLHCHENEDFVVHMCQHDVTVGEGRECDGAVREDGQGAAGGDEQVREALQVWHQAGVGARSQNLEHSLNCDFAFPNV